MSQRNDCLEWSKAMNTASIEALKLSAMSSSNREPAFASHIDLVTDVFSGKLTQSEANEIADKRLLLGCGMDSDFARQSSYEAKTRRAIGQNIATKGMGHRSLGAKSHGKSTVCVAGSGYGRYDAERLHGSQRLA
jgi:hypothetical protein